MGAFGSNPFPTHGQNGQRLTVVFSDKRIPRGESAAGPATTSLSPSSLAITGRASPSSARWRGTGIWPTPLPDSGRVPPRGWVECSRGLRSAARDDTPGRLPVVVTTPEGSRMDVGLPGLPASFQDALCMDVAHRGCRVALPPATLRQPSGLDRGPARPGAVGSPRSTNLHPRSRRREETLTAFLAQPPSTKPVNWRLVTSSPTGRWRIWRRIPEFDTAAPDIPHRIPLPDIAWRSIRGRIPQLPNGSPDVPHRVPFLHFPNSHTPRCLAEVPTGFRRIRHPVPQDSIRPPAVRFNINQ
jgi:hypothetical protein